eukprot:m.86969 g.86969  ORF g.86969 m.86969 type:complete len:279 (-) comp13574_c0_seq1:30-866(-)
MDVSLHAGDQPMPGESGMSSPERPNPSAGDAPPPTPNKASSKRRRISPGTTPTAQRRLPLLLPFSQPKFSLAVVVDARLRERRCARAMRMGSIADTLVLSTPERHLMCPVGMDECSLCGPRAAPHTADSRSFCTHARSRFSSTSRIKRRVHVLLFWKHMLGAEFPVVDSMLRDVVWRHLDSCEYGVRECNGHAKVKHHGVCVNPTHYTPKNYSILCSTLFKALEELGLPPDDVIMHALVTDLREHIDADELYFLNVCQYFRALSSTFLGTDVELVIVD